jgi:hypothetical protein
VTFDGTVRDMLIRLGWLAEDKVADAREIARAISALLADTARRS